MRRPAPDRGGLQLAVASLAVLLAAADTYVVVLALPDVMLGVGLGLDELQRAAPIVSVFLLGYVVALPLIGRLADLYGRVPVLVGCLVVFAVGSLLTAGADTLSVAVAGRALQGVGGGGLVPATLALVADRWPPERRGVPLGVVGGVQELGSVLGPLYGGLVLAASGWRAIFWTNLVAACALAGLLLVTGRGRGRAGGRPSPDAASARHRPFGAYVTGVLAALALVALVLAAAAPDRLVTSITWGSAYVPLVGTTWWSTPVVLAAAALALLLAARVVTVPGVRRLVVSADVLGATLLGLALGGVVLAFAAADPSRQAVSDRAPLLLGGAAVCAALFLIRQRRAPQPLVPRGALRARAAWGALAVNLFVGAALVAALVDVPVFARVTRYPDSQLGAALVLVRLLAALPVGSLLGGWLLGRLAPRAVAATGLAVAAAGLGAMTRWDADALSGAGSTVALVATGFGFGLAIAPVNAALLAATRPEVHGVASALGVVARTVGMLVGLSVLTAVGLRVFYREQARIGSPLTLCPDSPGDCPAYEAATRAAVLVELHAVFWGAAVCAAVAAVLAVVLLRVRGSAPAVADGAAPTQPSTAAATS